ncbi:unnamed protein product [Phytophthora fragariaefolia]|uniref:Unnamed protein product n=1 Tax=Phytophthora fragariaefolia TaxID=1490495 RepID=A0A9W6TR15_9STRA|nr:unnamed protein product [Phytophthora fragariaefolia]
MMALSQRPARKAKRTDVDYAVLSSGQQIPEYHAACGKPFQSVSILGNTSCYECLQEAKVDSLSALPRKTLDSIADFVKVLKKAKKIVVIAGAGISVSCGIPDFRSTDGIYAMARKMDVVLPEPECLFQIDYFREDPAPFFEVVRSAFSNSPKPSPTHWFLKLLQDKKKLLRVYTQNIDGLEEAAGVTRSIPCHGSFAYSSCMRCRKRVPTNTLMPVIQAGIIPSCSEPNCRGVLKPEITFFGEILDDKVSTTITKDRLKADLLLVMGTSLKVAPVMEIPGYLPAHIPQVVINKTALKKKKLKSKKISAGGKMSRVSSKSDECSASDEEEFDMSLLGDCDDIIRYICAQAGWSLDPQAVAAAKQKPFVGSSQIISHQDSTGKRVYCFGECQCKNKLAAGMNDDDEEVEGEGEEQEEEVELGDEIVWYVQFWCSLSGPLADAVLLATRCQSFKTNTVQANNNQLVWNAKLKIRIYDPQVDVLSVLVKNQQLLYCPIVGVCVISLGNLIGANAVDQWYALRKGNLRIGRIRLQMLLEKNQQSSFPLLPVVRTNQLPPVPYQRTEIDRSALVDDVYQRLKGEKKGREKIRRGQRGIDEIRSVNQVDDNHSKTFSDDKLEHAFVGGLIYDVDQVRLDDDENQLQHTNQSEINDGYQSNSSRGSNKCGSRQHRREKGESCSAYSQTLEIEFIYDDLYGHFSGSNTDQIHRGYVRGRHREACRNSSIC